MKLYLIVITALMMTLVLPRTLLAQGTDLGILAADSVKPLNTGDIDAAMAAFTDDAVVKLMIPGAPETYTGAAEIRSWMEGLAALHWKGQVEILKVEGNLVTSRIKTWMDPTRAAGIAPLEGMEEYTFREDKIVAYTWTPTEETLAKLAKLTAPESLPQSGGVMWPAYAALMSLGGVTLLTGLSLWLRHHHLLK